MKRELVSEEILKMKKIKRMTEVTEKSKYVGKMVPMDIYAK